MKKITVYDLEKITGEYPEEGEILFQIDGGTVNADSVEFYTYGPKLIINIKNGYTGL